MHGQTNFSPIRLFPHHRLPVSRHAMLTMEDYLTREITRAHDEDLRHDRGSQVQTQTIKKHTCHSLCVVPFSRSLLYLFR